MFTINRPGGDHQCLTQRSMWDSWKDLLQRNTAGRFSEALLKGGLKHLLFAFDYMHPKCKLVHTGLCGRIVFEITRDIGSNTRRADIKADNILHAIVDQGILETFVKEEMETPSPRKHVDSAPVYMSRSFGLPEDF
ncbi:hypothetical protein QQX98_006647 [Neonectria punicea]|uniref:Uncharacterized protein n=1 Tax=Neonectria punicea TaxID=979145 RepID=A0ABR1H063_9HYPO